MRHHNRSYKRKRIWIGQIHILYQTDYLVYGWRTNENENKDSFKICWLIFFIFSRGETVAFCRSGNISNFLLTFVCKWGSLVAFMYRFVSLSANLFDVLIRISFTVEDAAWDMSDEKNKNIIWYCKTVP